MTIRANPPPHYADMPVILIHLVVDSKSNLAYCAPYEYIPRIYPNGITPYPNIPRVLCPACAKAGFNDHSS